MDDVDLAILHAQRLGQIAPQGKRTLRMGAHGHVAVFQPGDRAEGADRCMGQVAAGIFGADPFDVARLLFRLTGRAHDDGFGAQLLRLCPQTGHIGELTFAYQAEFAVENVRLYDDSRKRRPRIRRPVDPMIIGIMIGDSPKVPVGTACCTTVRGANSS